MICKLKTLLARSCRLAAAFGYAVLLAATTSCTQDLPAPNAADVTRRSSLDRTSTLIDLEQGRELYRSRCGSCHALRNPLSLGPDAWVGQVRDMRENKGVHLSPEDARRITAYLVAVSSR